MRVITGGGGSPLRDRRGSETLRVCGKMEDTLRWIELSENAKRFRAATVTERTDFMLIMHQSVESCDPPASRDPSGSRARSQIPSPISLPPKSSTNCAAAAAVPPVARTSSTIRTVLPRLNGIAMNLDRVGPIFQTVRDTPGGGRQFLRLANRCKPCI